jgi:hypothetical protein
MLAAPQQQQVLGSMPILQGKAASTSAWSYVAVRHGTAVVVIAVSE